MFVYLCSSICVFVYSTLADPRERLIQLPEEENWKLLYVFNSRICCIVRITERTICAISQENKSRPSIVLPKTPGDSQTWIHYIFSDIYAYKGPSLPAQSIRQAPKLMLPVGSTKGPRARSPERNSGRRGSSIISRFDIMTADEQ